MRISLNWFWLCRDNGTDDDPRPWSGFSLEGEAVARRSSQRAEGAGRADKGVPI